MRAFRGGGAWIRCLVPLEQLARGRYRPGELGFIDLFAWLVFFLEFFLHGNGRLFMADAFHDITIVGMLLMGLRIPVARILWFCGF